MMPETDWTVQYRRR